MEGATSMLLRRQLRIVLHQIQSAENLGAVARLLANFDFPVLRLSDPQLDDTAAANRTAVHAEHVLASAERAARLEEAVAEAVYVLGTSGRDALRGRTPVTPEEGVERLRIAAARGPVALVLGGERRGLSDEELARRRQARARRARRSGSPRRCHPAVGPTASTREVEVGQQTGDGTQVLGRLDLVQDDPKLGDGATPWGPPFVTFPPIRHVGKVVGSLSPMRRLALLLPVLLLFRLGG